MYPHPCSVVPLASYLDRPHAPSPDVVGGKAARLVWLARHGFEIPRTWVIEAGAFRTLVNDSLPRGNDPRSLLAIVGHPSAVARMTRAHELILGHRLDDALVAALEQLWQSAQADAPWGLAVRSSATSEDAELTSMAGLATTVLGVRGVEQLVDAVRTVWASAVLHRGLTHLASRGIRDIAMGVVVQRMVPAEASGVMFTRPPQGTDPLIWGENERLINATFGLGAPVVNGAMSPDMIRFRAGDGAVLGQTIARKSRALVINGAGPHYVDIPEGKASEPALSPHALSELAKLADALERVDNVAHDVEFAVHGERVVVVQARPVVGTGFPEGGDCTTVWSRANVSEALPGVATPLTWSVARGFSERGFRQAFGSLGCSVPKNSPLVANVHGRFYLNLTSFMRIAAQVPGMDPKTLTSLGGGEGPSLLNGQVKGVSRKMFLARLPFTGARLLAEQVRLTDRVARFDERATQRYKQLRSTVLGELSEQALGQLLREVRDDLDETGTLMLTCASASLASHLALKTLLGLISPGDPELLARSLTAGVRDLESAKPGIAIARIARLVKKEPHLAADIVNGRLRRVEQVPSAIVRTELERFLAHFGDRAVREPELATPRWREDHPTVFRMVATALQNGHNDDAPERTRLQAEAALESLCRGLSGVETAAVRALVARARATTALRETTRAWVTRALGSIRWVALEVDQRLRSRHGLPEGSVFLCTFDELLAAMEDGKDHLSHVVELRLAEMRRDEMRPDPPVTFVGRPPPVVLPPAGGAVLRGLAASAGVVEGTVRVLMSGSELIEGIKPGEILVARTTDVGLTPLFLLAAGVVTELGGPLSHAALVAREYGVPAVVNVAGATVALKTGDRVRLDGNRGLVERLETGAWDSLAPSTELLEAS